MSRCIVSTAIEQSDYDLFIFIRHPNKKFDQSKFYLLRSRLIVQFIHFLFVTQDETNLLERKLQRKIILKI